MKPIVQLIDAWDEFTAQKTNAYTVDEFCEFYLNKRTNISPPAPSPSLDHELAKVIGRLGSIQKTYSKIAFKQLPGIELEWYFLLHTVKNAGEIRKTDVISFNLLLEPTTCIDILNRMIKAGLLNERIDPADKRARLLTVTDQGESLLNQLQKLVGETNTMLYGHLDEKDKTSLIKVLKDVEATHATRLPEIVRKKR
ncbi:MAG: winged helix DNA-binding protein [Mucilaginibacter sp.]|uniref:MarR family winged helix-turn-helix transcriptional regulator n=1 Tax=Mucilaginibacter sp. TaxID=1882438 RepID=UPI0031B1E7E4